MTTPMTKDLWPEEESWPGEQLAAVFDTGGRTGKGETRMITQEPGEDRAAFLARYAVEPWELRRALRTAQGWCFASETDPSRPMDRHLFDKWLTVAERKAGLPKLQAGLWHPYRRKWATERKALPIPDVAAAGGWTGVETLPRCYQQPERETLLRVTAGERKLREAVSGA